MIFLWMFIGSLLVAAPFYIFYDPYNLWPSVYAGGIGAAVYLIALYVYFYRTSASNLQRVIVGILMAVFFVASAIHWNTMDTMTAWQRAELGKIRVVIADGIFTSDDVCDRAIPAFVEFHKHRGSTGSIVKVFQRQQEGKIHDSTILPVEDLNDNPMKRYVFFHGDTSVVLISVDTVAHGTDPTFRNYDGSTGRVQMTTTVSEKEVRNERNN